jgi:hypothetical protein
VLGIPHYGFLARQLRNRVNQFGRRERRAAHLALVAVSGGVATNRALALNVAVGQKLIGFFVEVLTGSLLDKIALVVEFLKKAGRRA